MARRWTAAWAIMMLIAGMAVAVQVVPLAPASAVSSHPTTIAAGSVSWTVSVTSTPFSTGGGTAAETIPAADVTYWSGPATATSGSGTFTPGQLTAAAVSLDLARTAFQLTGGSGVSSASWNPTLSVLVPPSAIAGTYTATITHSVSCPAER